MEMSRAYFEATLKYFESKAFAIQCTSETKEQDGQLFFTRMRADCILDDHCSFVFESLIYPDGHEEFFLEIKRMGRMRSFSFPLDSWKYHANRVEFKYRDDPATGLGLSLTIDLLN
jgi:hypothetical protein